jgi:hypothetical protein
MIGCILPRDPRKILSVVRPAIVSGLVAGLLLSILLTAWLFVANRLATLEPYAVERNAAAAAAGVLIAALPFLRFRRSARGLVLCGMICWGLVSLCYFAWSLYFDRLADRVGAFHLFVMGAVIYGLAAALVWVGSVIRALRRHQLVTEAHHPPLTHQ